MSWTYGVAVSPDGRFIYTSDTTNSNLQVFKRDSAGPSCSDATITVQAGSVGALPVPCSDVDGDPFEVSVINPPTLGTLGAIDNAAHTIVYAAPQGQNGTTTVTLKAAYPGGAFASGVGSITVNVVGAAPPGGGAVAAGRRSPQGSTMTRTGSSPARTATTATPRSGPGP